MIRRRISRVGHGACVPLVGAAALTALAACGDEPGPADVVADCLADAGVTGPAVAIRDFAFFPDTLRVTPGAMVTWVNCEEPNVDGHTTTSDEDVWDSGFLFPEDRFERRFEEAGAFPYHCVPHPFMRAVVIVEEPATEEGP